MLRTLNVGCGNRVFKEYPKGNYCINLDIRSLPGVGIVADVRTLPFDNSTFDYILASDIIEHFPVSETVYVLKEWTRVLKLGGLIEFRLPNLKTICEDYVKKKEAPYFSWLLYGGQDYPGNFHYVCFDRNWFNTTCSDVFLEELSYKEESYNMVMVFKNNKR